MKTAHDSSLGKRVDGSHHYDPGLLFAIARAPKRAELDIAQVLPFHGLDLWNAYEISWLDARGKPRIALGEFRVPADSPCLVESKSLKLYLNSFNETRFDDIDVVRELIGRDLSLCSGGDVAVDLRDHTRFHDVRMELLAGESLDELDIDMDAYGPPRSDFLHRSVSTLEVEETLVSHLMKSNCPVTGQPDWASVQIEYRGAPIDREGLLRYLVSFRRHDDFHEQCVERIFVDLMRCCAPEQLTVHARYTRRGGLDINPWRSNHAIIAAPNPRLPRQ